MKLLTSLSIVFLIVLGSTSCKKDNDSNVEFTANLNGANEVPPNNSTATGTATATFNKDTKVLTTKVTHNVTGASAGHIHIGEVGTNGGVEFPFTSVLSPINFTSVALTTTQEASLNAGLYYVNIHSATYPGGEIRGQLIKK